MIKNKFAYALIIACLIQSHSVKAIEFSTLYNHATNHLNKYVIIGTVLFVGSAVGIAALFYKKTPNSHSVPIIEIDDKIMPLKAQSTKSNIVSNEENIPLTIETEEQKTLVTVEMFSLKDERKHTFEMYVQ